MSDARRRALRHGADAEVRVAKALDDGGWSILARNWRGGRGELDIVALKEGHLRFVEVKARATRVAGLEALSAQKQRRLISAGEAWLSRYGEPDVDVTFLVAIVTGSESAGTIHWLEDPFDGS